MLCCLSCTCINLPSHRSTHVSIFFSLGWRFGDSQRTLVIGAMLGRCRADQARHRSNIAPMATISSYQTWYRKKRICTNEYIYRLHILGWAISSRRLCMVIGLLTSGRQQPSVDFQWLIPYSELCPLTWLRGVPLAEVVRAVSPAIHRQLVPLPLAPAAKGPPVHCSTTPCTTPTAGKSAITWCVLMRSWYSLALSLHHRHVTLNSRRPSTPADTSREDLKGQSMSTSGTSGISTTIKAIATRGVKRKALLSKKLSVK